MKNKKGFERASGVLIIHLYQMDDKFNDAWDAARDERSRGYNRYYSEFDPGGKGREDYSKTFTQAHLEEYWQDQVNDNNYKGTLEEFINDYGLQLDVWFINSGYDFTGITQIIIDR